MSQARSIILAIATNKRLVSYGLILLTLHVAGVLFLYEHVSEFDNVPHLWFGYVLSEYSSVGATSINLQNRLVVKLKNQVWTTVDFRKVDFLTRLGGFLLIGGLFWEWAERFFSPFFGIKPDSFFAFPITLRNIDGALDVTMGVIGVTLAFLIETRAKKV